MCCLVLSCGQHTLEFHVDTFFGHRQLSALNDLDRLLGLVAGVLVDVLDLLDDVVALENLTEDDVLAVEPPMEKTGQLCCCGILHIEDCEAACTYEVMTVVMKNCEPLVSLPALAMDSRPFLVCLSLKFSSGNLSP